MPSGESVTSTLRVDRGTRDTRYDTPGGEGRYVSLPAVWVVRRPTAQPRPPLMAPMSSPLPVSPESSQKKAPPRPWLFAYVIFPLIVAGVS